MYGNDANPPGRERLRDVLGPHAHELKRAAEETDDPAEADVFAVMAAVARGEPIPIEPAERMVRRVERED